MESVAIIQLWNWGWTYMGLDIQNCGKGIDISAGGSDKQDVGSLTVIDSTITNTPVGIVSAWTPSSKPLTAGSIVLENVALQNVPVAVQGPSGTLLSGSGVETERDLVLAGLLVEPGTDGVLDDLLTVETGAVLRLVDQ